MSAAPGAVRRRPSRPNSWPSSRSFRNPLYLRVEDVPGARSTPEVEAAGRAGRALNTAPLTALALPRIVDGLRGRGLQLVKLSELLAAAQ